MITLQRRPKGPPSLGRLDLQTARLFLLKGTFLTTREEKNEHSWGIRMCLVIYENIAIYNWAYDWVSFVQGDLSQGLEFLEPKLPGSEYSLLELIFQPTAH